jgi:hypothetical protein
VPALQGVSSASTSRRRQAIAAVAQHHGIGEIGIYQYGDDKVCRTTQEDSKRIQERTEAEAKQSTSSRRSRSSTGEDDRERVRPVLRGIRARR